MAGRLWLKEIRRGKMLRDVVVPCPGEAFEEALREGCRALDLAVPLLVPKHRRDWEAFRQMRFLPEHFGEPIAFDRLEAEYFDPDAAPSARGSRDPRNG